MFKKTADLEAANLALTTELAELKKVDVVKPTADLATSQADVTRLTSENAALVTERDTLKGDNGTLTTSLATVTEDRDKLKLEVDGMPAKIQTEVARVVAANGHAPLELRQDAKANELVDESGKPLTGRARTEAAIKRNLDAQAKSQVAKN